MLASRGWNCAILGQKVLWVGAQIAARVAKAREVNDGLRALFLPPHGRHPRTIAEAIRAKGPQISHEGVAGVLADSKWTDDQLDFMMAHPILINRPIVVTPKGVKLCRPSEAVVGGHGYHGESPVLVALKHSS
jgi:hypothetical protein